MAETIKIGGELESMATGKIVAAASAILDKLKNKTQELINQENTSGIQTNAEDIANLNAAVASLQQLIDAATITGGTVANAVEVFVAAIAGLNANNVQAALGELNDRTGGISKSATSTEDDEIRFETDGGTLVGKIDDNGADFVNLKKNGQDVATENQVPSVPTLDTSIGDNPSNSHTPSTKAVKDYVDDNIPEVPEYPIETETTQSEAEEVIFGNDAGTQQYVKVSSEGVRAVAYKDMQGNNIIPVKDSSIGENPSTTHVPTTKAVKDYVDAKQINLPITEVTTYSEDEEMEFGDNAGTQSYAKVGSYGVKSKAYLDMNGNSVIPTKDTSIGDTPSMTNVPTSKAVADYVSAHGGGGGDLPISKESTASVDEEQVWGNDAGTDDYAKIGEYGIKAKKLLGLNGSPYLNMAENLQDYLLDAITYKPLGKLSKPYLVVIMDDGNSAAATYTIPNIVINEGIPITFALASNSQIITNNTYLQTLQSAISNYGCGVCQHGFSYWGGDKGERTGTMLTEAELVAFFENEKQVWEALNIECLGAACPDHLYDYKTMAVAFHYWHVLCNGVGHSIYPYSANCERTNRLELQRMSLRSFSESQLKNTIDYTYANNGLLIVFSHDTQFQDNLDNCRDKLLSIVPYAQTKGLTICSLNKVIKDEFLIHSK